MRNKYIDEEWYIFLKRRYKLSDDDMHEYISAFEYINRGDRIDSEVLTNFVNDESNVGNKISKKDSLSIIRKINSQVCSTIKNYIDLKTFLLYIIPICQTYNVNRVEIKELFEELDIDGDGKITCDELISILYHINKKLTPDDIEKYKKEINNICHHVDKNKDGYISFTEFKNYMNSIVICDKKNP